MIEIKKEMDEIFSSLDKDSIVAILVQHSPDPDCMGAAAGFMLLLREVYGLRSKTYHNGGKISHPQNLCMKNVLHINISESNNFDHLKFSAIVVLDTDLTNTGFENESLVKAEVRIDHHTMDRGERATLEDVRLVGSTCSIIWEYLKAFSVSLEEEADIATALLLGIKTDTLDFTSVNTVELDIVAYRELLPLISKDSFSKVMNFTWPEVFFEIEAKAFVNRITDGSRLVSFVGELKDSSRDVIPTIADRFARISTIQTVCIFGIIDGNIIASVRNSDDGVDVSELCRKIFGEEFSGAKDGSGGARVPLGPLYHLLNDELTKESVLEDISKEYIKRFLEEGT